MRLQLQFLNDSRVLNDSVILDIVESIKESIKSGDPKSLKPIVSSDLFETKLIESIKSIEGVTQVTRQTLSHPFGCGGMYGNGIEVKIDDSALPRIMWNDDFSGYLVNVEKFLNQFERSEKLESILSNEFDGDEGEFIQFLESINPELNFRGDNTYNYSSDLSSDLNFWSPNLSCFESMDTKLPVIVSKHLGGDVRGNYESPRVYLLDYDDFCNFIQVHFGFWSESIEEYSNGYTSEPQYSFFKDYKILELVDQSTVKAKNLKTGEIQEFICDVNF